jgi:hypothetical protein
LDAVGSGDKRAGDVEGRGEGDDDSDSSLDLHTPLPLVLFFFEIKFDFTNSTTFFFLRYLHLMVRHGPLSPNPKLLPRAGSLAAMPLDGKPINVISNGGFRSFSFCVFHLYCVFLN